ncbi:MAG: MFS transporter [Candidatus Latescibacter sp.]|nr:MFS transporter [Candidatus Latescibacter sp.]
MKKAIPQIVIKLGILSLLNDISSEMVFPLLPLFLAALPGGGPMVIGIIEGVAETTGMFLKLASGFWSDRIRRRTPFVIFGYALAGITRPLIALATVWPMVLFLRFSDRVGKGMRGAPRDAMIADSTVPERRGTAFGFQRMMDHTGAVIGPLCAALLISSLGFSIKQVILCAAIPSIVLLIILFTLREPPLSDSEKDTLPSKPAPLKLSRDFRLLLAAVFVFTLGNSSDAFLILRLHDVGVSTPFIALLWAFHHTMKITGAWAGGKSTDRFSAKPVYLAGLGLYAIIYLAFGTFNSNILLILVFILYGLSIGMIEPAEGAWVAALSTRERRSSAYGVYNAAKGFALLPASAGFGLLWHEFGQFAAFLTGAGLAFTAAGILLFVKKK